MPKALVFATLIGLGTMLAAIAVVLMASRFGRAIRFFATLAFVPIALFCPFGFAAAMEPGEYHFVWRILYAATLLASLVAIGVLVFAKSAHAPTDPE